MCVNNVYRNISVNFDSKRLATLYVTWGGISSTTRPIFIPPGSHLSYPSCYIPHSPSIYIPQILRAQPQALKQLAVHNFKVVKNSSPCLFFSYFTFFEPYFLASPIQATTDTCLTSHHNLLFLLTKTQRCACKNATTYHCDLKVKLPSLLKHHTKESTHQGPHIPYLDIRWK